MTNTSAPAHAFQAGSSAGNDTRPTLDGRLKDLLAGKKIVMTGVTGFIGEHLLWKILTELPETTAAVLVRRKGSADARSRVVKLVRKKIFADLVAAAGSPEALVDERIEVIEGDLPNVPALPADLDVVVHCAGDVSFDPPIDQAFRTNTIGTEALIRAMLEACSDTDGNLVRIPHYLHVSTAYTAGRRRGAIREAPHEHDIDYRVETEHGLALGAAIELESRTPARLTKFRKAAERDHRRAGYLTTSVDTERRRKEWVSEQLVKAGTERARSLGWTDVYTFTKALGERVVTDVGRDVRLSVVRPAIVESAWKHPYPGWIEGYKMAEPLIMAYGKGRLPEFPASPDSVIDIVPVDHVVNAIVAVCATEPEVGDPQFYHLNSGARNPITFRTLYELVRQYFIDNPFETDGRGTPIAHEWDFPGAAAVERLLATSEKATAVAARALTFAPRSAAVRRTGTQLAKQAKQLAFLRRYLDLYNEYGQSELHFVDDNTLRLHHELHPDDVDAFAFDSAVYDWHTYLVEVHCPAVTEPVRRLDRARRRRGTKASTFRDLSTLSGDQSKVLAAFDLDGTVLATNVIETYLWTRLSERGLLGRLGEVGSILSSLPGYLHAERRDRGTFLRAFYRRYAGADVAELERAVDEELTNHILERVSAEAIRRIKEHRAAGHRTILLTGAIRPLTRPIAPLFDVVIAADLITDEHGIATGFLTGPPMVGESRSAWLKHYAALHDIDLANSYAYADSHVDLPMLSAVGHPVVVSPDLALMKEAQERSWSTVDWKAAAQVPRWSMPTRKF